VSGDLDDVARWGLCNLRKWDREKFTVADAEFAVLRTACNPTNSAPIRCTAVAGIDGDDGPIVQEGEHMRCVMIHIDTVAGAVGVPLSVGRRCLHMSESIGKQVGQVGPEHFVSFHFVVHYFVAFRIEVVLWDAGRTITNTAVPVS